MLLESRTRHIGLEPLVGEKLRHRFHIDVGHVEPTTGRGAVGAGTLGIRRIEGMDGVQPHEMGSPGGGFLD